MNPTIILFGLMLLGPLQTTKSKIQKLLLGQHFSGNASYYGAEFVGRKTASGERLSKYAYTCAHRTLPFGTLLEVENPKNKKWIVVKVNDRGPFSGKRIIDLSYGAAKHLGLLSAGVGKVKVTVVGYKNELLLKRDNSDPENQWEGYMPYLQNNETQVPFKN
jgi:rare lipoprotein A